MAKHKVEVKTGNLIPVAGTGDLPIDSGMHLSKADEKKAAEFVKCRGFCDDQAQVTCENLGIVPTSKRCTWKAITLSS